MPQEFAFGQGLLNRGEQARSAEDGANVINHGGDQGAAHDAAGYKGRKGAPRVVRRPRLPQETPWWLPPGVTQQITGKGGADGGAQLPIRGSEQVTTPEQWCHSLGWGR